MRTIEFIGWTAAITSILGGCSSSGGGATSHTTSSSSSAETGDAATTGSTDAGSGQSSSGEQSSSSSSSSSGDGATSPPASPERMLITFGGATTSETVVLNVKTKQVEGRIGFDGFGVTDTRNATGPMLLEGAIDVVAALDPTAPWQVGSTWNSALMDGVDGGVFYSQPVAVVEASASNGYILRYERNDVAVFNPSMTITGGAPASSVDLSSFVQAGDPDGLVDMMGGAYDASSSRVYVVLGNINQIAAASGSVPCSSEVSTVVAIDTKTNTVASLGGSGPKGSIALKYYNPISVVYDAAGSRLIVVSGGCNAKGAGDGGVGAPSLRGIEAVNLTTGQSSSLLDLSMVKFPVGFDDMPTGFAYIDSTHAVIGFDQTGEAVYAWNPTETTIGAVIPNAPDVFTYDGQGNLLGTRVDTSASGTTSNDVVSVAVSNGASVTLASNVTSLKGQTYTAWVDVWPHP